MKPTARKRLGKYVLLGRLGHGGMGKIYLAYTPGPSGIEKLLVIKRLHSHLTGDPVLVNNFLDEARLSMALTHPNIVHTYDVGEVDGRYFIVMEYIDGQNLGVLLRTAKRSNSYPDSALWGGLFLGVLDALHAAHTAKDARGRELHIIHRDVSPQNVLVTYDGMPKLVDFGIAKAALRISETDAGVLKGKYSYMSPEQCQSQVLDPRSDVFSAGIVLWEMLAGRRLYKADSIVKSVERILTEAPISPSRVNAECDVELSKVVVKALAKKPNDRFSSAEEFRYAIDEALRKGRHFRPTEVRDLMERLFKDVRDRQQKLLEACLSGGIEGEDDENVRGTESDSDSHPAVSTGSPDSESDLLVPNLALANDHETTTPSSARRSPLVTQEEEDEQPAAVVALNDMKLAAPPLARTEPSIIAPPQSPSKGSLVAMGAGIGVVILLLGLFGVAVASGRVGGDDPVADPSGPPVVVVRDPAASAAPSSKEAPGEAQKTARSEADEPPPPAAEEKEPEAARMLASAATADEDPPPAAREKRATRDDDDGRSKARAGKSGRGGKGTRSQRADAKADDDALLKSGEEKGSVEEAKGAFLTLETTPWSVVYLGKKKLGETPLVNVPIPSGELELLLVNPGQDIRQPYFLKVGPGESVKKKLALD